MTSVRRGDFIKLRSGATGQVIEDHLLHTIEGDRVAFCDDEVADWCGWDEIKAYKDAQLPKARKIEGQRRLGE